MPRIVIVMIWAVWMPLGLARPLEAQDQLVRPAGLSLHRVTQRNDASESPAAGSTSSTQRHSTAAPSPTQQSPADSLAVPLERSGGGLAAPSRGSFFRGPLATIAGALAITLGLFAVVVVVARRGGRMHARGLPREAFEVIGQTAIGPRQRLMVVRVGTQALVIGTSPAGIQTVAQFDDPDEAGQLIAQCRGMGASAAFRTTLSELEREAAPSGFVDHPPAKRGNLFLRA